MSKKSKQPIIRPDKFLRQNCQQTGLISVLPTELFMSSVLGEEIPTEDSQEESMDSSSEYTFGKTIRSGTGRDAHSNGYGDYGHRIGSVVERKRVGKRRIDTSPHMNQSDSFEEFKALNVLLDRHYGMDTPEEPHNKKRTPHNERRMSKSSPFTVLATELHILEQCFSQTVDEILHIQTEKVRQTEAYNTIQGKTFNSIERDIEAQKIMSIIEDLCQDINEKAVL